jgi:RNA polymerase sigma-70 factor (ECF subfamily)
MQLVRKALQVRDGPAAPRAAGGGRADGAGATDEDHVVERLSQNDVVAALSEVPHDFRDVVVLVDIGDFTYADAAQILDIPIGTVMSRLHRGRRLLKQQLAEEAIS